MAYLPPGSPSLDFRSVARRATDGIRERLYPRRFIQSRCVQKWIVRLTLSYLLFLSALAFTTLPTKGGQAGDPTKDAGRDAARPEDVAAERWQGCRQLARQRSAVLAAFRGGLRRAVQHEDLDGVVMVGVVVAHEREHLAARQYLDYRHEIVAHRALELAADRDDRVALALLDQPTLALGHGLARHAHHDVVTDGRACPGRASPGVLGEQSHDVPADRSGQRAGRAFLRFGAGHVQPPRSHLPLQTGRAQSRGKR